MLVSSSLAGSETTATTLSGLTYYLSRNPRVYKLLTGEIRSSFSAYNELTGLSTAKLPYLNAVIEEGLRIYPPVPIGMPRVSPGETVDAYYLPLGTVTYVQSWGTTRNEQNIHNPSEFIPERWISENTQDRKEARQPFLLGPRVCLGRKYVEGPIVLTLPSLPAQGTS